MGPLPRKKGSDGDFCRIVWKRHIVICIEVHAVSTDLPLHRSDSKLGSAGEFEIDAVFDAFGSATCSCGTTTRCNCRLDGYNPVLLVL